MFQNFGVQKISISEKSSEDLGMHISLPKPYANVSKVSWVDNSHRNHAGLSSSSDSTKWNEDHLFVVQTNSLFNINLLQNHFWTSYVKSFGQNLSSWSNQPTNPPTNRKIRPAPPPTTHKLPIKAEAPKPPKAVSGSFVPPTLQGAQSFCVGSWSLWVSLCWDPKNQKNERNREQWAT